MRSTLPLGDFLRNPLVIVSSAIAIAYFGYLFGRRLHEWVN